MSKFMDGFRFDLQLFADDGEYSLADGASLISGGTTYTAVGSAKLLVANGGNRVTLLEGTVSFSGGPLFWGNDNVNIRSLTSSTATVSAENGVTKVAGTSTVQVQIPANATIKIAGKTYTATPESQANLALHGDGSGISRVVLGSGAVEIASGASVEVNNITYITYTNTSTDGQTVTVSSSAKSAELPPGASVKVGDVTYTNTSDNKTITVPSDRTVTLEDGESVTINGITYKNTSTADANNTITVGVDANGYGVVSRIDDNATCAVSVPQDTSIIFGTNKFTAVDGPATFTADSNYAPTLTGGKATFDAGGAAITAGGVTFTNTTANKALTVDASGNSAVVDNEEDGSFGIQLGAGKSFTIASIIVEDYSIENMTYTNASDTDLTLTVEYKEVNGEGQKIPVLTSESGAVLLDSGTYLFVKDALVQNNGQKTLKVSVENGSGVVEISAGASAIINSVEYTNASETATASLTVANQATPMLTAGKVTFSKENVAIVANNVKVMNPGANLTVSVTDDGKCVVEIPSGKSVNFGGTLDEHGNITGGRTYTAATDTALSVGTDGTVTLTDGKVEFGKGASIVANGSTFTISTDTTEGHAITVDENGNVSAIAEGASCDVTMGEDKTVVFGTGASAHSYTAVGSGVTLTAADLNYVQLTAGSGLTLSNGAAIVIDNKTYTATAANTTLSVDTDKTITLTAGSLQVPDGGSVILEPGVSVVSGGATIENTSTADSNNTITVGGSGVISRIDNNATCEVSIAKDASVLFGDANKKFTAVSDTATLTADSSYAPTLTGGKVKIDSMWNLKAKGVQVWNSEETPEAALAKPVTVEIEIDATGEYAKITTADGGNCRIIFTEVGAQAKIDGTLYTDALLDPKSNIDRTTLTVQPGQVKLDAGAVTMGKGKLKAGSNNADITNKYDKKITVESGSIITDVENGAEFDVTISNTSSKIEGTTYKTEENGSAAFTVTKSNGKTTTTLTSGTLIIPDELADGQTVVVNANTKFCTKPITYETGMTTYKVGVDPTNGTRQMTLEGLNGTVNITSFTSLESNAIWGTRVFGGDTIYLNGVPYKAGDGGLNIRLEGSSDGTFTPFIKKENNSLLLDPGAFIDYINSADDSCEDRITITNPDNSGKIVTVKTTNYSSSGIVTIEDGGTVQIKPAGTQASPVTYTAVGGQAQLSLENVAENSSALTWVSGKVKLNNGAPIIIGGKTYTAAADGTTLSADADGNIALTSGEVVILAGATVTVNGITYSPTGGTMTVDSDGNISAMGSGATYEVTLDANQSITIGDQTYTNLSDNGAVTLTATGSESGAVTVTCAIGAGKSAAIGGKTYTAGENDVTLTVTNGSDEPFIVPSGTSEITLGTGAYINYSDGGSGKILNGGTGTITVTGTGAYHIVTAISQGAVCKAELPGGQRVEFDGTGYYTMDDETAVLTATALDAVTLASGTVRVPAGGTLYIQGTAFTAGGVDATFTADDPPTLTAGAASFSQKDASLKTGDAVITNTSGTAVKVGSDGNIDTQGVNGSCKIELAANAAIIFPDYMCTATNEPAELTATIDQGIAALTLTDGEVVITQGGTVTAKGVTFQPTGGTMTVDSDGNISNLGYSCDILMDEDSTFSFAEKGYTAVGGRTSVQIKSGAINLTDGSIKMNTDASITLGGKTYTAKADGTILSYDGSSTTLISGSVVIPDGGTVTANGITFHPTGGTITVDSTGEIKGMTGNVTYTVTLDANQSITIGGQTYTNLSDNGAVTLTAAGSESGAVTVTCAISAGKSAAIGGKTYIAEENDVTLTVTNGSGGPFIVPSGTSIITLGAGAYISFAHLDQAKIRNDGAAGSTVTVAGNVVKAMSDGAKCYVNLLGANKTVTFGEGGTTYTSPEGIAATVSATALDAVTLTSGQVSVSQNGTILDENGNIYTAVSESAEFKYASDALRLVDGTASFSAEGAVLKTGGAEITNTSTAGKAITISTSGVIQSIDEGGSCTIDLGSTNNTVTFGSTNGKTYTAAKNNTTLSVGTDGKITLTSGSVVIPTGGELTANDCTFQVSWASEPITVDSDGKVTLAASSTPPYPNYQFDITIPAGKTASVNGKTYTAKDKQVKLQINPNSGGFRAYFAPDSEGSVVLGAGAAVDVKQSPNKYVIFTNTSEDKTVEVDASGLRAMSEGAACTVGLDSGTSVTVAGMTYKTTNGTGLSVRAASALTESGGSAEVTLITGGANDVKISSGAVVIANGVTVTNTATADLTVQAKNGEAIITTAEGGSCSAVIGAGKTATIDGTTYTNASDSETATITMANGGTAELAEGSVIIPDGGTLTAGGIAFTPSGGPFGGRRRHAHGDESRQQGECRLRDCRGQVGGNQRQDLHGDGRRPHAYSDRQRKRRVGRHL